MEPTVTDPDRAPRRYDNTRRRLQAAETRERIIAAGSQILHRSPVRDWQGLTVRAVADQAGVNERTVYRHFENERRLRDAVMHRLEEEAGIDLGAMSLEDVATVAARVSAHVASFPRDDPRPLDPTLSDANQRQREALIRAVAERASEWSTADQETAAAILDVLWSVGALERLIGNWQLDHDHAVTGITWAIGLVERAVRDGERPTSDGQSSSR
jgi:AcrR family transcriptional regulator